MQHQTTQAAWLTELARQPSFTAAPVLTSMGEWVTWNAERMREGAHTLAAEIVCDAGEYVMARKNRQRGGGAARRVSALAALTGLAFWAGRKAAGQ